MIQKLVQKQRENGLNDTEMAEMLGIARGYWNRLKNGKGIWNDKIEMKARRAFPGIFEEDKIPVG